MGRNGPADPADVWYQTDQPHHEAVVMGRLSMLAPRFTPFVLCVLAAYACSRGPVSLPDAKFPIPVPADATLVDTSHALTGEGFAIEFQTVSWTLKSPKPLDEIVAFYKSQLPAAAEDTTEDGETFLTFVPPGAKPREKVVIFFYANDRIHISQDTLK
jgi:hypothetical protein